MLKPHELRRVAAERAGGSRLPRANAGRGAGSRPQPAASLPPVLCARVPSGKGTGGRTRADELVTHGQGGRMMAEDATPLVEAILTIIDAARTYLPPDGFDKDAFITRVLDATDNPRVNAALAAHGHPVSPSSSSLRRAMPAPARHSLAARRLSPPPPRGSGPDAKCARPAERRPRQPRDA